MSSELSPGGHGSQQKKKGSGIWILGVVALCACMYGVMLTIGRGFGQPTPASLSAVASHSNVAQTASESVWEKDRRLKEVAVSASAIPPTLTISTPSLPLHPPSDGGSNVRSSAKGLVVPALLSPAQWPLHQIKKEVVWSPPPSQARFGATNPRGVARPPMKPQADSFLKARSDTWERCAPQI